MLYDALSTLADAVGKEMSNPELLTLYMPPLIQKWQSFGDDDRDLLPLMEVFAGLAISLGRISRHIQSPPGALFRCTVLKGEMVFQNSPDCL